MRPLLLRRKVCDSIVTCPSTILPVNIRAAMSIRASGSPTDALDAMITPTLLPFSMAEVSRDPLTARLAALDKKIAAFHVLLVAYDKDLAKIDQSFKDIRSDIIKVQDRIASLERPARPGLMSSQARHENLEKRA